MMDVIMNPVRQRIFQYLLVHETCTVKDLRRALPDIPSASLYRHMKLLTDSAVLAVAGENRVRGTVESIYRLNRSALEIDDADGAGIQTALLGTCASFAKYFASGHADPRADDALRASVYSALEAGCTDFRSFTAHALPDMRRAMAQHPQAEHALRAMLSEIDAERILVIESGCAGTFPLLLMSLDPRVDLRMYTTYPYLTGILGERLFTHRYEELLTLETMASQERYLRFSALRSGRFYVRRCADAEVERQALQEIKAIMK